MRSRPPSPQLLRRLGWTLIALLVGTTVACGGGTQSMRRCPDSPQVPCLTGEECSIDEEHDCERCRCAEPYGVHEQQADPLPPASPE